MIGAHHIEALKFDLEIPSKNDNYSIQNRIIRIFNAQFHGILNEFFDRYGATEQVTIESINLQLEPVSIDTLEKDLVSQFKEQLALYFENYKITTKHKKRKPRSNQLIRGQKWPVLLFYLHHGIYPWYETQKVNFAQQWQNMVNQPEQLKQLCLELSGNWNAIKRLFHQLDENDLRKTLEKLLPGASNLIMEYHDQLDLFFNENTIARKTTLTHFKRMVWWFTLQGVGTKNAASFSVSNFIADHLEKLAHHYKVEAAIFGQGLSKIVKRTGTISTTPLIEYLNKIFDTDSLEQIKKKAIKKQSDDITTIREIEKILSLQRKTAKDRSLIQMWVLGPRNRANIQKIWIAPLRERVLENVLYVIVPDSTPFIMHYHKRLRQLHGSEMMTSSFEAYQRANWTFTFDYFTTSFSSVFQAKGFVKYHLKKLADHYYLDSISLVQNLLLNIHFYNRLGAKYVELNSILKVLAKEGPPPVNISTPSTENSKYKYDIQQITTLLHSTDHLVYEQVEQLKKWLFQNENWTTVEKKWISDFDEKAIKKWIQITLPREQIFISQFVEAMVLIFSARYTKAQMVFIKKDIYRFILEYIVQHVGDFQNNTFIDVQLQKLMYVYKLKEDAIIGTIHDLLKPSSGTPTLPLAIVSILPLPIFSKTSKNQNSGNSSIRKIDDLNFLWHFLETGNLPPQDKVPKTSFFYTARSVDDLLNTLENIMTGNQRQWYTQVQEQGRTIQIHTTFEHKMKPSLLRSIQLFKINYNIWIDTIAQLKNKTVVLKDPEIAVFFYLKEETIPNWISEDQLPIRNGIFSKPFFTALLAYKWSLKMVHRWTHNLTKKIKYEFLVIYLKGISKHFIVQLYVNLPTIFNSIPTSKRPPSVLHFEMSFWYLFFQVYNERSNPGSIKLSQELLEKWMAEFQLTFNENQEFLKVADSSVNAPTEFIKQNGITSTNSIRPNKNNGDTFLGNNSENKEKSPLEVNPNSRNEHLIKWHIENAGLILTHPLLNHLYGLVKYLDVKKQFKDEESQFKAVYLLHYIATGKEKHVDETALAMSKILCGMDIKQAIPNTIVLSKEEKETADELLSVLINRWGKLGKTNPEVLRNSFLVRKGLLEEKDNAYHLTIESSGIDVLLDFIPWNIKMVKLPWLKQLIYISWR